jgi:type II secretory pathway pseudopilin PulG
MMAARKNRNSERGAGLVVLLALMTVMAIALLAMAPSVQQQVQRDRELEEIRRGEEIAEAIRQYVSYYNGAKLPNNMDDLLEGLPAGTKKRMILRPSAAVDLFSDDGKWRLVQANSKTLQNFARRVQNYYGGVLPSNPDSKLLDRYTIQALVNVLDTDSLDDKTSAADETDETSEDTTDNVPFIAVVSGSKSKSVIAYYGIENHSKWIFTPLFRGNETRSINSTRQTQTQSNPNNFPVTQPQRDY